MAHNADMNILSYFFYLADEWVMVRGASYSLLVHPASGRLNRINDTARKIIESGERGQTVSAAAREMEPDVTVKETAAFIRSLSDKGVIMLSSEPVPPKKPAASSPLSGMDFIWIEVTPHCNLRCIHCYADADGKPKPSMSTPEIKRVIDEASALGWKRLQFTGGECTTRPDLQELILYAKSRGFEFIEIFTNGTLLEEPMVQFLAEEGIHVGMSLYSYRAETHDAITGIPGSYEKSLNAIKLLLRYKVATRCATIAMKQNEEDLDATTYFVLKLGISCRTPDPIRPTGRGKKLDNWPEKYGLNAIQTRPGFKTDPATFLKKQHYNSCWYGKAGVTSSGDVLPCLFARDHVAGNIHTESLSAIIRGEKMQQYWNLTFDRIEPCRQCEYRYVCDDCRPWAYGFTGDLYAKSPRCTYNPLTGRWGKAQNALKNAAGGKVHTMKQKCQDC
jgi:radical SAM protein with 4Fe4S-binding SPASM domain